MFTGLFVSVDMRPTLLSVDMRPTLLSVDMRPTLLSVDMRPTLFDPVWKLGQDRPKPEPKNVTFITAPEKNI